MGEPSASNIEPLYAQLSTAAKGADAAVYAVLDGAKFEDLPALLFDNDLSHKPLYLDMGSELREIERTTPQLVRFDRWQYWENELTPDARLRGFLELLEDLSAAVFWIAPGSAKGAAKTLYKHLRTINNIMIPRDADTPPLPDPLDPEGETFGNTATHQQVLFRHADANVMAQVLPVLSPVQLTRTLGPASEVIFAPDPEWGAGEDVMTIANPKDTYASSHPLKLSNPDMDKIEARRLTSLRHKTIKFLREQYPKHVQNINNKDLYKQICKLEAQAETFDLDEYEDIEKYIISFLLIANDNKKLNVFHDRLEANFNRSMEINQLYEYILMDVTGAKTGAST